MDIWQRLKYQNKPILLYGTGNGADKILDELYRCGVKVSGVFASDGFVRKRSFRGFEVISFSDAEKKHKDFIALLAFGSARSEVLENIEKISQTQQILCADVSVYGGEIFNEQYAKSHKDELLEVYSHLADNQSKKVFEQTVKFKLDGNLSRLFDCQSSEDEAFENVLCLKSDVKCLDLGAYNGDSVLSLLKRCESAEITAVEPDQKTFLKLVKNTEGLNVTAINAAVTDVDGQIGFNKTASRGSYLGGESITRSITVDSLKKHFDFIKFDVEGSELLALEGAKQTIAKHKPKMLVSCYHRADDYFALPLKILSIRPDYKIYMRHYPCVPAWDTNFYFV